MSDGRDAKRVDQALVIATACVICLLSVLIPIRAGHVGYAVPRLTPRLCPDPVGGDWHGPLPAGRPIPSGWEDMEDDDGPLDCWDCDRCCEEAR